MQMEWEEANKPCDRRIARRSHTCFPHTGVRWLTRRAHLAHWLAAPPHTGILLLSKSLLNCPH